MQKALKQLKGCLSLNKIAIEYFKKKRKTKTELKHSKHRHLNKT